MTQAIVGALRVTLGMDSPSFSKGLRSAESRRWYDAGYDIKQFDDLNVAIAF